MATINKTTKTKKINGIEFTDRDVLECEFEVISTGTIIEEFCAENKAPLEAGIQRKSIMGSAIERIMKKNVQTTEDQELIDGMFTEYNKRLARLQKKLKQELDAGGITEEDVDEQLTKFRNTEHPYGKFIRTEERDILPLRNFRVVENKGPAPDDIQAKNDDQKQLMEAIMKLMAQQMQKA